MLRKEEMQNAINEIRYCEGYCQINFNSHEIDYQAEYSEGENEIFIIVS